MPTQIHYTTQPTPLGTILIAQTPTGVCALFLADHPAPLMSELQRRFPTANITEHPTALAATAAKVLRLIDNPTAQLTFDLDLHGNDFEMRVWNALLTIPPGTTRTYGEIARQLDCPGAARAVGTACGANPVAIIVPCHRVVKSDGALSGYRWGVERKRKLLSAEGSRAQEFQLAEQLMAF